MSARFEESVGPAALFPGPLDPGAQGRILSVEAENTDSTE